MKHRPTMLSATFVRNINIPGRYGDGRGGLGLSLLVKPASRGGFSKSWSQSVRLAGKAHQHRPRPLPGGDPGDGPRAGA